MFAGGAGGLGVLAGPTGGYLLGFLPAAVVTAWLRGRGQWPRLVAAVAAGLLAYYIPGTLWLSKATGNSLRTSLGLGVLPYLPGDALKAAMAVLTAAKLKKVPEFQGAQPCCIGKGEQNGARPETLGSPQDGANRMCEKG